MDQWRPDKMGSLGKLPESLTPLQQYTGDFQVLSGLNHAKAYSNGDGIFECQPWMRVSIRENQDPFQLLQNGQTGGINIIDLANVNSCSFIATDDYGFINQNGFELLGRLEESDLRGCNQMLSQY